MEVYIDADACPVVRIAEKVAKEYNIPIKLFCDTNHILKSDYSKVYIIDAGADAVDIAVINRCKKGDIIITQDYGVAALALGKGAHAIHQSGMVYTDKNIEILLMQRHLSKKDRMSKSKNHFKGHKKRTKKDDINFETSFRKLLANLTKTGA